MTVPCFLMALLCGWVARVQACKSDLDCSLNGDCKAGKCDCDAAWEGEQCERFATVPTPPGMDIKEPGVTTWGGQAVQHNGRFHMFVSEYVGNCGITSWLTNSQTTRFVADKPEGPWSRKEVVIPVWSTCPSAAITPNGTVVLWTMGNGGGRQPKLGPDAWGKRCENGSTPCGFAKHGCGPNAPPPLHPPPPPPQPHDQGVCTNAWANVSNYKCFAGNCLSDGSERAGNCGDGLCYSAGPPPRHANDSLCAPLTCTPYKDCSVAAGIRCDSDPRCHSFALYSSPWEGQRAKFFNNTGSGTTPVTGWTAWTQVSVDEREDGNSPPWESQAEVDRRPGRVFSPTASRSGEGASTFPLHVSSTGPEGPWKTIAASVNERLTYSLAAPWILPNGTTFWVMQTDIADAPWIPKHLPGNRSIQGSVGTIIRGETYEGPYKVMSRGACSVGEDHSMYIDKRGFHCISHRFSIIGDPACKAINGHLPGGCTIFGRLNFVPLLWICSDYDYAHRGLRTHAFSYSCDVRLDYLQMLAATVDMLFRRPDGMTHGFALTAREATRTAIRISRQRTTRPLCTRRGGSTDLALESDHMCCSTARRPLQSQTLFNTARPQAFQTLALLVIHTAATRATEAATISGQATKIAHSRASPHFGL